MALVESRTPGLASLSDPFFVTAAIAGGASMLMTSQNRIAVNQANSRSSKGFSVSGVGAIVCRHGLVRKNGVVDLQKGKR